MENRNSWAFIAWAPHSRRSELLAAELGARIHFIHYLKFQAPLYAPVKYIPQSLRTLQVLLADRPAVVFVQSPPFLGALMAYLYCRVAGAKYVIDHHSASFARRWDWAMPIQKYLARRAVMNIVTNQHWADVIRSWQASVFILPDPFVTLPEGERFRVRSGFNVVFVNTFSDDEPTDAVLNAAAQLPDVHFYITGNKKRKPQDYFDNAPSNVTFTDFLPDAQYFGLLRSSNAVIALTTRNYTLQSGGCEAVSIGKPLITSDWPYLRELFARGAVYVSNSSDGVRDGILALRRRYNDLEQEIVAFRNERRREWDSRFAQLKGMVLDAR